MSAKTLLIEIGTEELPPKSLNRLRLSLAETFERELKNAQLSYETLDAHATPRRLALVVTALVGSQPTQSFEKRGPAVRSAFGEDGQPTRALEGFMRGCGISDPGQLDTQETDKGDYLVFRETREGLTLAALLPDMLQKSLTELPVEKRMRWGKHREEFVRPISWAVCLYGEEVMPLSVLGIEAGRTSRGHRFMSEGAFEISAADAYVQECRQHFVIVDFDGRKASIREQVESLARAEGAILEMDEALLDEVTSLVEWPVALAGGFDEAFLAVPAEVLISAMKEHQRYFHLVNGDGQLLPRFITVSNIQSIQPEAVISGNERVIRPRLSDAAFFFDQDTRLPLVRKVERLTDVVFQTELGSYHDKATRIASLSGHIAQSLGVDAIAAQRAGLLAKADLVSDMVSEFPDLQGIMGGYYAARSGEADDIVKGIAQHYRPVFSGGALPDIGVASCTALADKLDSLVGLFGINQPPTGSRDPFALRRQSLGVIRICVENQMDFSLTESLQFAAELYGRGFEIESVSQYIIERLGHYYAEQGITGDVVEAATHGGSSSINLLKLDDVIKTLQVFRGGPVAAPIIAANKRVANLLKKTTLQSLPEKFDPGAASEDAERALHAAIMDVNLDGLKGAGARLEQLSALQAPVDRFFDEVLVMADDPHTRNNRLALLNSLRGLFLEVADFSLLQ